MAKTKLKLLLAGATFFTLLLCADAIGLGSKYSSALELAQLPANSASAKPEYNFQQYVPPPGRGDIERTEGSGSRGCPAGSMGSIALLIPNDHIGLTVSGRPTFSWYVSSPPSTPMQFALVEQGVAKPLLVKVFRTEKSGLVQLQLPPNIPELSIGKSYRWTVSLVCNSQRPSENIYVRSRLVRVADPIEHTSGNFSAQMLRERAAVYARSGIWYDALASVSKAYLTDPTDNLNARYLRFLLDEVGLSQVPISQPQNLIAER